MFQLQIISTTVTCGNHTDIVTQHLNRQRMSCITNQQHPAGEFCYRNNLTDNTFIANYRLPFVDAVIAAFVDDNPSL